MAECLSERVEKRKKGEKDTRRSKGVRQRGLEKERER